jgi:Fe-S cluster assembly protein SufD
MIPALAAKDGYPEFLKAYRSRAWEAFESSPMPTTTDEAWRRTDIRGLEAGSFRLPDADSSRNLPGVPAEFLQPVAGEKHGGQLILTPGKPAEIEIDPALTSQGVVFTDQDCRSTLNFWRRY